MAWQLQRFPTTTPAAALAARAGAIVLALVVSGVILSLAGADPLALGSQVVRSAFGSRFGLQDFGLLVTPLILCGLAVAVTLRIGIWNIGAEGQFAMGALRHNRRRHFRHRPGPGDAPRTLRRRRARRAALDSAADTCPCVCRRERADHHAASELRRGARRLLRLHRAVARQGQRHDRFDVQGALRRAINLGHAALRHRDCDRIGGSSCCAARLHPLGLRGAPERSQSRSRALCRHPGPPAHHRRDAPFRRPCRDCRHARSRRHSASGCRAGSPTISAMSASWSRSSRAAPASA